MNKVLKKLIKENWNYISSNQKISELFFREFQSKVDWIWISSNQKLSEDFIREFQSKVDLKLYREVNNEFSREEKIKIMKKYAKKYSLEFDGEYLFAFRNHDQFGRGMFNKTIFYKKGKYKDFHCDMRPDEKNSFGLGIFPKGNTKVKVSVDDFGIVVNNDDDGKCRVKGFTVL